MAVGDLITATILPPQNGTDLLSFFGQTVQAQLPPGIDPGQTLLLQVTGFSGNQILVRNIGVVDPNNPPPTVNVTLPSPEPGAPLQATLVSVQTPAPQQAQPSPQVVPQQPQPALPQNPASAQPAASQPNAIPPPVAPPRAVFVAASVQRAQSQAQQVPAQPATPAKSVPIVVPAAAELGLEARIAATRAASIDIAELVNQPAPQKSSPVPAPARQAPAASPATIAPPAIAPRAAAAAAPVAPELALLARLRIPALPFTLAAARLANSAASILPKTLARLDAALGALPQDDPRAATIRTIAAFIDKIDLGNARALPEQLMAYVSNVVDGAESKLAALVRALDPETAQPPEAPQDAPAVQTSTPASAPESVPPAVVADRMPASPQAIPANAGNDASAAPQPALTANATERAVALQYDLKAAVVSMLDDPPRGSTPQLAATLGETLTTITAVQLGAVNAQNADPSAIVIPLPAFYYDGGRPAQLRISRDAPEGGKKLDADNFHIAFVLDTKSLGTVAVDVQTASRSVSINVKTEVPRAAARFRDTFDDLRGRLEQLRYRVANIAANVAPPKRPDVTPGKSGEPSDVDKPSKHLDLQA